MADEVISAVCEVQLGEVDAEACHPAHPESDPQRLAPEVHRHQDGQQHADDHEKGSVVSARW